MNGFPHAAFTSRGRKELLPDAVRDVRLTAAVTNTPGALGTGTNWFCSVGRERRARRLSCAEGMFYPLHYKLPGVDRGRGQGCCHQAPNVVVVVV